VGCCRARTIAARSMVINRSGPRPSRNQSSILSTNRPRQSATTCRAAEIGTADVCIVELRPDAAPQRDAEAHHCNSGRDGQEPVEGIRHQGENQAE
jgi:hypothetical protein